jgi:hypothetical protein
MFLNFLYTNLRNKKYFNIFLNKKYFKKQTITRYQNLTF